MQRFGIVSDTHGLLRPELLTRLEGCQKILHAGDVGKPEILEALSAVAPVIAVRGNVDHGPLASLPAVAEGDLGGISFLMTHQRSDVEPRWSKKAKLIIFGHSHRPELEWRGNSLWLNPGAVGPRRFSLPLTFAMLNVDGDRWAPEILSLES